MRIKFVCLVFTLLCVWVKPGSSGLLTDLKRDAVFLYKLHHRIHAVFEKLGHDPNKTVLATWFPEAAEIIHRKAARVEECYNSQLGEKKMSIFKVPLGKVIHRFLKIAFAGKLDLEVIHSKIHNLIKNMRSIGRVIIDCVKNEDPDFEPTAVGLNKFSSEDEDHLSAIYLHPLGRRPGQQVEDVIADGATLEKTISEKLPETFDYRDKGVVSPIKDQKNCGTCFLFGAVAAIESSYMLKHNKKGISFSEKHFLDCMWKEKTYTNEACQTGGRPKMVFDMAKDYGLTLESKGGYYINTYPSETAPFNFEPKRCSKDPVIAKVTHYGKLRDIEPNDDILKSVLLRYGPVTTLFRAEDPHFLKLAGKFNHACNVSKLPDHVMTIVGWTKKHWIIKNSWGTSPQGNFPNPFGVKGWLYARTKHAESCGIFGKDSEWTFPFVE